MLRIKKPLARKMYYSGIKIIAIPCKCKMEDINIPKIELNMMCGGDIDSLSMVNKFDRDVRDFEVGFNSKVVGYYSHFYVSEKDMECYEMCDMMCS